MLIFCTYTWFYTTQNTWANGGKLTQSIIAKWKPAHTVCTKSLTYLSHIYQIKFDEFVKSVWQIYQISLTNVPHYFWQVYQISLTYLWDNFYKFSKSSLSNLSDEFDKFIKNVSQIYQKSLINLSIKFDTFIK